MNKLFAIILAFVTVNAIAKEPVCTESVGQAEAKEKLEIKTDVPNRLKGAKIIVRLANGEEVVMPIEKFKVVPRKQQFIVTKVETNRLTSCTTNEPMKNRVSVLGGYGAKNGLTTSQTGNTITAETKSGADAGLQYQRMLKDRISAGFQVQTNKTASVMVGLDF